LGLDPRAILIRLVVNTVAILVASKLVDGIYLRDWQGAVLAGAIFGVVNSLIKPVVRTLTCPLYMLTIGLFALVVNALMLVVTSWIAKQADIGFNVDGFGAALVGALIVGIVAWFVAAVIPDK
jgi:putative membrane protein